MFIQQTSSRKDIATLVTLIQCATETNQPITLNMTLGVFNDILSYRTQEAIEAYKKQVERIRQDNENGDLATTKEAKAMFPDSVSDATLWRWCKQGLLHKKNIGGKVYYSRIEIANLIKEG